MGKKNTIKIKNTFIAITFDSINNISVLFEIFFFGYTSGSGPQMKLIPATFCISETSNLKN